MELESVRELRWLYLNDGIQQNFLSRKTPAPLESTTEASSGSAEILLPVVRLITALTLKTLSALRACDAMIEK